MEKDAWLSWVVYTVSTASSYILGAAVLHPQGRVPEGSEVLTTISRIVTDTLGSWVGLLFLLLAALALFTTILADVPSLSRQIAASMAVFGLFDWGDRVARDRWMRVLIFGLPVAWGLLGVVVGSPLALVVLGGILTRCT